MAKKPTIPFHRLRSLSIVGGFMDGAKIEFAPNLNCLIGARGTGKTTVLEFIRFALDEMPDEPGARKRIDSLVDRNLAFGRVELGVETKDGLSYIISRAAGEEPVVLTQGRKPTEITLKAGSFFKADIFSQNEVESIADRSLSQLELIDSFEADQIAELNIQLRHADVELSGNASAISPLQEKIAALDEELAELPALEEKLKGLSGVGGADADAINEAHVQKALRDREKRTVDGMTQYLAQYDQAIEELVGQIEQEVGTSFGREMLNGPNKGLIEGMRQSLLECSKEADLHLRKAQARIRSEQEGLSASEGELAKAHTEQEMAFRALIEKHQAAMGQETERAKLEKRRNDLLAKKRERGDAATRLAQLQGDRTRLMQKLSELRDARFQVRKAVADRINTALEPTIRVTIVQDGNPERYRQLVEETLRGARLKYSVVAQKIVYSMWPSDLVTIAKSRNAGMLVDKAELNPDQAEKVVAALNNSGRLHELETVELIDEPKIELNDGGTYKDSGSLSTGQKCTTILPILLLESDKPLLIDQPEDNLDNRFISQTVVESLRREKSRRQLIFVTHNPNIPVLGDSERVFVLESDGTSARIAKEGDVDVCKAEIVTLLEGGEEAFKLRKERYNY